MPIDADSTAPLALYVDWLRSRREAVRKNLRFAHRDLRFDAADLGQALLRLREESPALDLLVVYGVGWKDKRADMDRLLALAEEKRIPAVFVVGPETVEFFQRERPGRDMILFKDTLQLAERALAHLRQRQS